MNHGGTKARSRDPRRGLMKKETPIVRFYNQMQSSTIWQEFIKAGRKEKGDFLTAK